MEKFHLVIYDPKEWGKIKAQADIQVEKRPGLVNEMSPLIEKDPKGRGPVITDTWSLN